jgi:hypothetical protein
VSDYSAPAQVYRVGRPTPGLNQPMIPTPVYKGTVAECVRLVMAKKHDYPILRPSPQRRDSSSGVNCAEMIEANRMPAWAQSDCSPTNIALSRRKQGFSPLGSANDFNDY